MNSALKMPALLVLLTVFFLSGIFLGFSVAVPGGPAGIGLNQAVPLTDSDYFPTVQHLIDSANSSVDIMMYSVNYYPDYPDSIGHMLLFDLEEAAKRGVDVRVITDQTPTEKPVLTILREMGIDAKFDSGEVTTHAKLIIIDSEIVIIGSTNWSYYSIDKNHEANVIIRSESLAREFGEYFEGVWRES